MIVQGFWAPLKRLARIISENGHAALDIGPQRIGENMAGRGGMMAWWHLRRIAPVPGMMKYSLEWRDGVHSSRPCSICF